jgi:endonuclease/exonuclease/phosphatase family metal-dependent hydrolase
MDFHFFPRLRILEQQYGDAVLSRLSTRLVKAAQLPAWRGREPRGALWVAISTGGSELQVINTHLGLWSRERLVQIEALLGREWLSHPGCREPFVLTGDFNAPDRSRAYRRIVSRLTDAYRAANCRPKPTYPTRYPVLRLDHVFVSRGVEVVDMRTLRTPLARFASDHFPVIADLNLPVLHVHGSQFAMLGDDPAC